MRPPSDQFRRFDAARETGAALIRRFEWVTVPSSQGYTRRLVLALTSFLKKDEGVRSLQFTALGSAQPFLQISDVSGQQWDGVVYHIVDMEHDTLSVRPGDFSFSVSGATE